MQQTEFISVAISCEDALEAERLGRSIVQQKLAACAQYAPINSIYEWRGRTTQETETLLTVKTVVGCFEALQKFVRKHHSYDTPQITATPIIFIDQDYARWINSQTKV